MSTETQGPLQVNGVVQGIQEEGSAGVWLERYRRIGALLKITFGLFLAAGAITSCAFGLPVFIFPIVLVSFWIGGKSILDGLRYLDLRKKGVVETPAVADPKVVDATAVAETKIVAGTANNNYPAATGSPKRMGYHGQNLPPPSSTFHRSRRRNIPEAEATPTIIITSAGGLQNF